MESVKSVYVVVAIIAILAVAIYFIGFSTPAMILPGVVNLDAGDKFPVAFQRNCANMGDAQAFVQNVQNNWGSTAEVKAYLSQYKFPYSITKVVDKFTDDFDTPVTGMAEEHTSSGAGGYQALIIASPGLINGDGVNTCRLVIDAVIDNPPPPPPADPVCGDGTCNGVETCSDCASDCGNCPPGPPDPPSPIPEDYTGLYIMIILIVIVFILGALYLVLN